MQPRALDASGDVSPTRQRLPDDLMPERCLGRRLKEVRDHRGLSQAKLAEVIEEATGLRLDPTAITRIERGDRAVRLNEAVALSVVLGLTLDELIAPHPGSLNDQVERASVDLTNAQYAAAFWDAELESRRLRYERVQQQWQKWREDRERYLTQFKDSLRQIDKQGEFDLVLDHMEPEQLYEVAEYLIAKMELHSQHDDCPACRAERSQLREKLLAQISLRPDQPATT